MTNYLSDSTAFENAISRGIRSYRSSELKALLTAITEYIRTKTDLRIAAVKAAWEEWKERDPKEFADRGITLAGDFERELKAAYQRLGLEYDGDDDDDWEAPAIPKARTVVVNNHKKLKKGTKYLVTYGSAAGGLAEKVMVMTGALAAGSALVVGSSIAGGVISAGSSGLALRAYRKTGSHVKNLVDLYNHRNAPELKQCSFAGVVNPLWNAGVANPMLDGNANAAELLNDREGHDIVANQVLPYIIKQKSRKMGRKKRSAVPIFGLVEGGRAIGNYLAKKWSGTQGKVRMEHARWLANHFVENECELSRQIIAELYSVEEMYWLLDQEAGEVANFLAEKMQST